MGHVDWPIQLMIPWAILSSLPKRHHDRFSRFRTGDRRVSLYFTMGYPAPLKIAPYHGDLDPIEHTFPRAHRSPQPKRHFERFSCVCSAHYSSVTDRQTTLLGR